MNTPAHLVLNLTLLRTADQNKRMACFWAVLLGALLPDLPMYYFFVVEAWLNQQPQSLIWGELYFQQTWQNFFDLFNSIPIIVIVALFAWYFKNTFILYVCASMMLHIAMDLPLHHDDGHHHFYPLAAWRFDSPISYWDPNHHGHIVSTLEGLMTVVCCVILFLRSSSYIARGLTILLGLLYSVGVVAAVSGVLF